ncbi:DNRLRE domain-containing protein, partial [Clostridium sp. 19966]|uniref:DNRLRE domain-containing protein n=1 Tax=Clostridium sp. 19966 TaxID=2768166 RepID=UPI0028DEA8B5
TVEKNSSSVQYSNIYTDTDLRYDLIGDKVKENIVINKPQQNVSYSFNLNAKNLIPQLQKDNSIIFYDDKDSKKAVFQMQAPNMYDAKESQSDAVKVSLDKTKNGYNLTVTPDSDWLSSSDRVYPVTIDPPVETNIDRAKIQDTFVSSIDTENKANNILLYAGFYNNLGIHRSYVKFDLPQLSSSDMVINAQLSLNCYELFNGGGQVNVHKVLSDWNTTNITWANQPGYNSRIEDYNTPVAGQWSDFDITSIAKEWYNSGNNFGLMLKADNENSGDAAFRSADTTDANARPRAYIDYVSNTGLESYWTYHSQDVGRAGTGYVNDYNGNLVFTETDLALSGSRAPVGINHVYSSNDKDFNIGYGDGWRLNYSQRFEYSTIGGVPYYVYTDDDGTRHYFKYDASSNEIKDELNLGLTLIKEGNSTYTIKDKNNNAVNFWGVGDIRYIVDKDGNAVNFYYGNASNGTRILTSLVDGGGRTTSLDYNAVGGLLGITDPAGRRTSYQYTNGKLTSINYPDGKATTYQYDGNGNLVNAINNDGIRMSYEYYAAPAYRVKKVIESSIRDGKLGEELNLSYGNNKTSFTDSKGKTEVYEFDDSGKTVDIQDSSGNAEYYKYDDNNKTKLGEESKLQGSVNNLLLNQGIEYDRNWLNSSDGGQGSTSLTAEDKYEGDRSIKIAKTDNVLRHYVQQIVTIQPGKTYTASAYIKTVNVSNQNIDGGAYLAAFCQDKNGSFIGAKTESITGSNDWKRVEVTFNVPQDTASRQIVIRAALQYETGTAYFDDFQLEEGTIANRFNMVENGDFSGTSGIPFGWTAEGNCNAADTIVAEGSPLHPKNFDTSVFRIVGDAVTSKRIAQSIDIKGNAGDSYVLSGWAKGESVPLSNEKNRYFAVHIAFLNQGTPVQFDVVPFNEDCSDWQYASKAVVAKAAYTSVKVYVIYYNNANSAYFDGIQLYKENFSQSYQYDAKGNVISTVDLAKQNSKFDYDTNNNLIKATDAKGNEFKYTYDGNHNLITATSAQNVVYSFTYDKYGNPLTSKVGDSSLFIQASASYTASGNYISSMTDSLGNTINYGYDENKGTLNTETDPKGKTTTYTYDGMDRLIGTSKTADGVAVSNQYSYKDDKIDSIGHNGFSYNFAYDSLGNNTGVSVGNQNLITNSYEDRTGKLLSSSYGNGQSINNQYDDLDRVIARGYNGATRYTYSYDSAGNLGYKEDLANGKKYRYVYDNADRLTEVNDGEGDSLTYGYDNNNNTNSVIDKIKNINYVTKYAFDKDNRLTEVDMNSGAKVLKTYDSIGRISNSSISTGQTSYNVGYAYKAGAAGSSSTKLKTITNNGSSLDYDYDANGNIVSIVQNGKTISYSYNELNELIREDNGVLNKSITYSYDAGGNIQTKTEYAYTTGSLGTATATHSYTYGNSNWKDELTAYDGKAITYDAIGNPLTYAGYSYSWEQGRQLSGITGNGLTASYKYDDSGIRTQKTVNGVTTNYHLVGSDVTYEDNGTDKIYYTYDSAGKLVSMNLNGVEYYYIRNGQSDIIGLFDKTGAQVVSYTYDTWGKLVSIDGSLKDTVGVKNPYRYRGYRYDTETGLYYLQSRYYNPDWGRFINADAIAGSLGELLGHNLFAYCKNSPVNGYDADGFRMVMDPDSSVGVYNYNNWAAQQARIAAAQKDNNGGSKETKIDDKPVFVGRKIVTNYGYGVSKSETKMYFDSKSAAELYLYKLNAGASYDNGKDAIIGAILDKSKGLITKEISHSNYIFTLFGAEMTLVDQANKSMFFKTINQINSANSQLICLTETHIDNAGDNGFDYTGNYYIVGTY